MLRYVSYYSQRIFGLQLLPDWHSHRCTHKKPTQQHPAAESAGVTSYWTILHRSKPKKEKLKTEQHFPQRTIRRGYAY